MKMDFITGLTGYSNKMYMRICDVDSMPHIPDTVDFVQMYNTSIARIEGLPRGLKRLEIYKNDVLSVLPELPPTLEHLHLAHLPLISRIPDIPQTLTRIELSNLDNLCELPELTHGYICLEHMRRLMYLPDPARVDMTIFNCPALKITQTGSYDAFLNKWKQFHAMR
jgi:hypothetical protein